MWIKKDYASHTIRNRCYSKRWTNSSFGKIVPSELCKYLKKTSTEFNEDKSVIQRNTDIVQKENETICGHQLEFMTFARWFWQIVYRCFSFLTDPSLYRGAKGLLTTTKSTYNCIRLMYLESSGICFWPRFKTFYKCGLNDHAGVTKMTTQLQVYLR